LLGSSPDGSSVTPRVDGQDDGTQPHFVSL
jgi:hypothetical protein